MMTAIKWGAVFVWGFVAGMAAIDQANAQRPMEVLVDPICKEINLHVSHHLGQ